MNSGAVVVFSAASGAGKSTLLSALETRLSNFVYSISATTRDPRGEEVDGVDYLFLSKEEFRAGIVDDRFVEWAEVHGNYYGTPKAFLEERVAEGKIVALDIDVQGKVLLDKVYPDTLSIFIEAPSFEELERRLRSRGTDSEEAITLRLENSRKEQQFAYNEGKFDHFVVNDSLDDAVQKILTILDCPE